MRMTITGHLRRTCRYLCACLAVTVMAPVDAIAQASLSQLSDAMQAEWHAANQSWSESNSVYPFTVDAQVGAETSRSSAQFALKDVSFTKLTEYLYSARNWCPVMLLHLNVKGCIHRTVDGQEFLDLYLGRKFHQTPDQVARLEFSFNYQASDDVFHAVLEAEQGPYGTSEYRFTLTAVPVTSEDQVFVKLGLSNKVGYAERLADVYLATLGRFKVGFTQTGKDFLGRVKYVKGRIGAAERNVVRYMLALEISLADTEADFLTWAGRWHKATQQFKKQLHEMGRRDYLTIKRKEINNQNLLQDAVDRGETYVFKKEESKSK